MHWEQPRISSPFHYCLGRHLQKFIGSTFYEKTMWGCQIFLHQNKLTYCFQLPMNFWSTSIRMRRWDLEEIIQLAKRWLRAGHCAIEGRAATWQRPYPVSVLFTPVPMEFHANAPGKELIMAQELEVLLPTRMTWTELHTLVYTVSSSKWSL